MITDEEFSEHVENTLKDYKGDLNNFYEVIGMVYVGRLMGWRVIRLVSSKRSWTLASKLFAGLGDLKVILPEEGDYAYKSVGLELVKKIGGYWDIIKGSKNRDELSLSDRKMIR